MKRSLVLCLLGLAAASSAQVSEAPVSEVSKRYQAYRREVTEPAFGLAKVKALIRAIKPKKVADEEFEVRATPAWDGLTTPERFTYCMIHGEDGSQNCDAMPWVVDEEHKVFAYPPYIFDGESTWSARQWAFLRAHRTDAIRLLRSTIRSKRRVGANLKAAIGDLSANELIPDLVWAYERDHKDQDILTVLMLLMKAGKYPPFLTSATYRKLYGDESSYQSFITANPANQRLTIERAMAFYHSRVG